MYQSRKAAEWSSNHDECEELSRTSQGTKRVSFDDRVIVIPIEARTEARSLQVSVDPLAVPSDHDPCRLLGGVVGGDSNSDGFNSAKFWKDFHHAWQKVLDPQAHIESGCLRPPQTCVHRCHLNPVALVLRRGAAAIQVVQGDDVGTCRNGCCMSSS